MAGRTDVHETLLMTAMMTEKNAPKPMFDQRCRAIGALDSVAAGAAEG
jgi:hypothetical protein